jgi:hydrogenase maturation factor
VRDARLALATGHVHALHDPTEGGVATGLWELAEAAGVGLRIERPTLPVLPECRQLCNHLGLDPLGLIGSGSLLVAASAEGAAEVVEALVGDGIAAAIIGEAVPREEGSWIRDADGSLEKLPRFARDEIAGLFD